jgi:hypothetical protein
MNSFEKNRSINVNYNSLASKLNMEKLSASFITGVGDTVINFNI